MPTSAPMLCLSISPPKACWGKSGVNQESQPLDRESVRDYTLSQTPSSSGSWRSSCGQTRGCCDRRSPRPVWLAKYTYAGAQAAVYHLVRQPWYGMATCKLAEQAVSHLLVGPGEQRLVIIQLHNLSDRQGNARKLSAHNTGMLTKKGPIS